MIAERTQIDTCMSESYFTWEKPINKQQYSNHPEFNYQISQKNNEQDSLMMLEQITHLSSSYDQADILQIPDKDIISYYFSSNESEPSSSNLRFSSSTTLKTPKRIKNIKQSIKNNMMKNVKENNQKQIIKKKKIQKINVRTNKKYLDYKLSNIFCIQKQDQPKSLHLLGGLVISSCSELKNQKNLKNKKIQNQQINNEIGMEIKCNNYENHIFNSYLAFNVQYVNEPLSQLSIQNQKNISSKVKQLIQKHLQQDQLLQDKLLINKIIEQQQQLNVQKILLQRESTQKEQIINYINTNFKEEQLYTIHVFQADFNHQEVNLNKVAFSHKLLSLMNFDFQKCSLSHCQNLLNQFFSIESYEFLQLNHFSLINNQNTKQLKDNQELSINTFDNISINCTIQVQMIQFQYTGQAQELFGNLNERVYFIKYNIDPSNIQRLCQNRIQTSSKLQKSKQKNSINQIKMTDIPAYSQSSYQFIKKYYSEEYNKFLEFQKIAQNDIQDGQQFNYIFKQSQNNDKNIFNKLTNTCSSNQIYKKYNQPKNYIVEDLINEVRNQSIQNSTKIFQQQSINNVNQQNINKNCQNQQLPNSHSLSQFPKQNSTSLVQNLQIQNEPIKAQSQTVLQTSNQVDEKLFSEIKNQNMSFTQNLQQYIQEQQQISEDEFDDDDDSDDIDVLILKIKLIKRYQEQMQYIRQQQMLQMKEIQEKQNQLIKTQQNNNSDEINKNLLNQQQILSQIPILDNYEQQFSNEEQNEIIIQENNDVLFDSYTD